MAPKVDVVGIGSCAVDFFVIVPRLLGPGEKINASRVETHAGGVTANMLTQAARPGTTTGWLGLIGDDENGRIIQKAFTDDGMDITGVEVVRGERSALTWIAVNPEGERCVYMFPCPVVMSNSRVRDALEASVTWRVPPVSLAIR